MNLPDVSAATPALRRKGFTLILVIGPSRGAVRAGLERAEALAADAGRKKSVSVAIDQPTPAERAATAYRLNRQREALHEDGRAVFIGLLDSDLPAFAHEAPDLWSVRTLVVRNTRLSPARTESTALDLPHTPIVPAVPAPDLDLNAVGPPPPARRRVPRPSGPAVPLLTRYPLALLVGDAGSGKTTTLLKLAAALRVNGQRVQLISLPEISREHLDPLDLPAALRAILGEHDGTPHWLLLDGLDEIPRPDRHRLVWLADDLVSTGYAQGAVLATRPRALSEPGQDSPTDTLPRVRLQPLDNEQLRGAIRSLERAGQRLLARKARTALGFSTEENPRTQRLRSLCRRPLLLRALLNGLEVLEELPKEHHLLDGFLRTLAPESALGAAEQLAVAAYQIGSTIIPNDPSLAASRDIVSTTGLVVRHRDALRFVHAALQDQLVARAVARSRDFAFAAPFLWRGYDEPGFPARHPRPSSAGRLIASQWEEVAPDAFAEHLDQAARGANADPLGRAGHVVSLLANTWGESTPASLRPLAKNLRDALYLWNRTPERWRSSSDGFTTALWLGMMGDPRLSGEVFEPMGDDWELAKWPVTVREFARFVDAGGYENPSWWTSEGWRWRKRPVQDRSKDYPALWNSPGNSRPWQPVAGISHHEAMAYVRWRQQDDPSLALPTLEEWQNAAQRAPLWLNAPPSDWPPSRYRSRPLPIGASAHLGGPIEDLVGLVREWVVSTPMCAVGISATDTPEKLKDAPVRPVQGGWQWWHPFGLRLARIRSC